MILRRSLDSFDHIIIILIPLILTISLFQIINYATALPSLIHYPYSFKHISQSINIENEPLPSSTNDKDIEEIDHHSFWMPWGEKSNTLFVGEDDRNYDDNIDNDNELDSKTPRLIQKRGDPQFQNTICQTLTRDECANITELTSIQVISQRDVQLNISMMDLMYLGFDLNNALFNPHGYFESTVELIPQILFLGFSILLLDLYWNEKEIEWQLCPYDTEPVTPPDSFIQYSNDTVSLDGVMCSTSSISFGSVVEQLDRFLSVTGNDLTTSLVQLRLRLHSLDNRPSSQPLKNTPNRQRLSTIVSKPLKFQLYTPSDLSTDRQKKLTFGLYGLIQNTVSGFIKVYQFLFIYQKRLLVSYTNITLLDTALSTYDSKSMSLDTKYFFASTEIPSRDMSDSPIPYSTFSNDYVTVNTISTDDFPPPNCTDLSAQEFQQAMYVNIGNMTTSLRDGVALGTSSFGISVADTIDNPFNETSIAQYITCGFVPRLTAPMSDLKSLPPLAQSAVWSWSPDQPKVPSYVPLDDESSDGSGLGSRGSYKSILASLNSSHRTGGQSGTNNNTSRVNVNVKSAWRCAVLDEDGWRVANCFDKYPVLCGPSIVIPQANSASEETLMEPSSLSFDKTVAQKIYQWSFGKNTTYFEAESACPNSNYTFDIPRTSLQDTSVRLALRDDESITYPIWIDMNSINVKDCWVTGGPLAVCPYTPNVWTRGKVVTIAMVAMVMVLLLLAVFLLSLDKVPIRHSEGRFRKLILKYNQNQYQGVPS